MNDERIASDVGVLLIGHGSVERPEDIPAFLAQIRRGRPTSQAIVDEVTHRWQAIGGSPLLGICRAQAAALQERLGVPVRTGMRLWSPWAKDVVRELASLGCKRIVSVPLAPYSVDLYNATTKEACDEAGVASVASAPWGENEALVDAFAASIERALDKLPTERRERAVVLSTAHSLPLRVIRQGDRYEAEVRATARAVAERLEQRTGKTHQHHVAFQSQGMDGGEWLGPDLVASFDSLRAAGIDTVVVCAIGFLADHTEVLFDLDIEARAQAEARGLRFVRADSLNAEPRFIDALESVARKALATG